MRLSALVRIRVAVIVLMLVGVALSAIIGRLQAYLLRWQQHNMPE
jgi:sulfonate transport system permease protein